MLNISIIIFHCYNKTCVSNARVYIVSVIDSSVLCRNMRASHRRVITTEDNAFIVVSKNINPRPPLCFEYIYIFFKRMYILLCSIEMGIIKTSCKDAG